MNVSVHTTKQDPAFVSVSAYSDFCTLDIRVNSNDDKISFYYPLADFPRLSKVAKLWNNPVEEIHVSTG